MAEFVKVSRVVDLPPGERLFHDFEYETVIVLNIAGRFYCIANICSHDDGPLEDGKLDDFEISCPRHGARFDVRNGRALCLPATKPIPQYAVKVEDGDIYVESPDDKYIR
ncbi:MAG: non-heme iron oxygenase ferredoxin subunit [Chloroflexi bacterium]|nr:non-heme iron oxygenase ferredoxin subunit [Chloroflexota bacterium]